MNGKPRLLLKHPAPEEKLLFVLTRQRFEESHRQTVCQIYQHNEIDWNVVYTTAILHRVAPLVYDNLLKCACKDLHIPDRFHNSLKQASLSNVAIKNFRAGQIESILSLLNEQSIDVMLVKGSTLDVLVYRHPWATISDDVDLIFRFRREELSVQEREAIKAIIHRHSHGMRFFEIGYFTHHDVTMHDALPIDFQTIWQDAETILYRGQRVYVMCPEDLLITACINSCRKRYFKLKALCDLAEIIERYGELDWTALVRKATVYACHAMVFTALLIKQL